jgi:hypothetical protein
MVKTNKKFIFLVLFLIFLSATQVYCKAEELVSPSVVAAILQSKDDLNGCEISAVETNVTLTSIGPVSRLLSDSNTNIPAELRAQLKTTLHRESSASTNVFLHVYKFFGDKILVNKEISLFDGKRIQASTLITSNAVLQLRTAGDTNFMDTGIISKRNTNYLEGVPLFLSKTILCKWIRNSIGATCTIGKSESNEECYIFNVLPDINDPQKTRYQVFFDAVSLKPVLLYSYSAEGDLTSSTQLMFGSDGEFICQKAITTDFEKKQEWRKTVWQVTAVATQKKQIEISEASFLHYNTHVIDERYNASYTMGKRPPTELELQKMSGKFGKRDYELATQIPSVTKPKVNHKPFLVMFLVVAAGIPILFLIRSLVKH